MDIIQEEENDSFPFTQAYHKQCLNAHDVPGPQSRASDQPWVTGNDVNGLSPTS